MTRPRRTRILSVPLIGLVALAAGLTGCSDSTSGTDTASSEPPVAGSSAAPAPEAASASSQWLASAAADPEAFDLEFDGTVFTDNGLRADVVLALLAADDTTTAGTLADALAEPGNVTGYIGDGQTMLYAGSTAKLLAVLDATDRDPRDVAGRDLVTELEALEAPSGRFMDLGDADYSQTVSQSWAVLALSVVDEASPVAVEFLAAQQCSGGGFPAQLMDAPTGQCEADVDATAFAVSALTAAGGDGASISNAVAWLQDSAGDDGATWTAAGGTDPSVNTTAVAAAALADAGEDAGPALDWLADQAITEGPDAGAFPLADTAAADPLAGDLRATAQAALALSGSGLAQVLGAQD